ncbi:MAG: POTRA domain-containing protein [Terracidiphilus sp.]|jgi:outer membrane protein insertion porin family
MKRTCFLLLTAVVLLASSLPATAQKFLPKTIQFKGAPEYSDQELMAAAGLKKGTVLAYADMKEHSQKLMDTGVFESLLFKFDGVDLIYTVVPHTDLYAIRLENLPLTPGKELDTALHDRLPLYHGKVPAEGGLLEGVRGALEEMIAAKGIKATVTATPYTDQKVGKVTAMSFSITAPPVEVGEIRLNGAAAPIDAKVAEILAKLTGSAYDVEGSPNQIETYLGNFYHDKGYLEAEIHAVPQGAPVVTQEAIHIPFAVSVSPGAGYKLAGIQLASGLPVTQAEFDRQSKLHPGDIAEGQRLTEDWEYLSSLYHNKGYMQARIYPTPSYDRAHGTVSFAVSAEQGPVYTMGKLTIENIADDLRSAIWSAWKLPTGAVFNESALGSWFAGQDPRSALGRTFASTKCIYKLTRDDDAHTVDVSLRLEKR